MTSDDKIPESTFDAIAAARELDESLGMRAEEPGQAPRANYESMLESELVELNALIDQRESRIGQLETEIARSRERIEREADRQAQQTVRQVLVHFLDVLDDLDRALAAARTAKHADAVLEGVDLVRKRFLAKLGEMGVAHRPALGAPFDPTVHEAVASVPVADRTQHGIVVSVLQEGYAIGDEPLRPARVAVGKYS